MLIFHNNFYRRKEAQEELQKAKLIISVFIFTVGTTERVVGDRVSYRGALTGSPNWVVSSRPQANSTTLIVKTMEWFIMVGELIFCFCYKKGNIELIVRSFKGKK